MRRVSLLCVLGVFLTAACAWGAQLPMLKTSSSSSAAPSSSAVSASQRRPDAPHIRRTHRTPRVRTISRATGGGDLPLFGDQNVGKVLQRDRAGVARAFPFTSRVAGTASSVSVYIAAQNRATALIAGIYSDRAGHPGAKLASGSLASPKAGAWNTVTIRPVRVSASTTYWLAILGRGGTLYIDAAPSRACNSQMSRPQSLRALPVTWVGGTRRASCPVSAYISGRALVHATNAPAGGAGKTTTAPNSTATAPRPRRPATRRFCPRRLTAASPRSAVRPGSDSP